MLETPKIGSQRQTVEITAKENSIAGSYMVVCGNSPDERSKSQPHHHHHHHHHHQHQHQHQGHREDEDEEEEEEVDVNSPDKSESSPADSMSSVEGSAEHTERCCEMPGCTGDRVQVGDEDDREQCNAGNDGGDLVANSVDKRDEVSDSSAADFESSVFEQSDSAPDKQRRVSVNGLSTTTTKDRDATEHQNQHQQQQQQQQPQQQQYDQHQLQIADHASSTKMDTYAVDTNKTSLIINYLPQTMKEQQFSELFSRIGQLKSVKLMYDKDSGYSFGYGFIDYANPKDAARAIEVYNGHRIDHKRLKVAYSRPNTDETRNTTLYIRNLPEDYTEDALSDLIKAHGEIVQVRVIKHQVTGNSRGIAFVIMSTKTQAHAVINELNGKVPGGGMQPLLVKFTDQDGGGRRNKIVLSNTTVNSHRRSNNSCNQMYVNSYCFSPPSSSQRYTSHSVKRHNFYQPTSLLGNPHINNNNNRQDHHHVQVNRRSSRFGHSPMHPFDNGPVNDHHCSVPYSSPTDMSDHRRQHEAPMFSTGPNLHAIDGTALWALLAQHQHMVGASGEHPNCNQSSHGMPITGYNTNSVNECLHMSLACRRIAEHITVPTNPAAVVAAYLQCINSGFDSVNGLGNAHGNGGNGIGTAHLISSAPCGHGVAATNGNNNGGSNGSPTNNAASTLNMVTAKATGGAPGLTPFLMNAPYFHQAGSQQCNNENGPPPGVMNGHGVNSACSMSAVIQPSHHDTFISVHASNNNNNRQRNPTVGMRTDRNVLYVYGLRPTATEAELSGLFSSFGKVARADVVMDHKTKQARGFGFVVMEKVDDAGQAVRHMNGHNHQGRILQVRFRN